MGDQQMRGITFRSLTEQMDTATPHDELLFSLFGALAQFKRQLTPERVIAGLATARQWGRRGEYPPTIYKGEIINHTPDLRLKATSTIDYACS